MVSLAIARCPCDDPRPDPPLALRAPVLGCNIVLLLIWFLYVARKLWRTWRAKHGRWKSFLYSFLTPEACRDPSFTRKLEQVLQRRRLEHLRSTMDQFFSIVPPFCAFIGLFASDPWFAFKYIYFETMLLMLMFVGFLMMPESLTVARAHAALGTLWVLAGAHVVLSMNAISFLGGQMAGFLHQILLAQLVADLRPAVLFQIPVVAVQFYYITYSEALRENNTRLFYMAVVLGSMTALVTSYAADQSVREQARQEVLRGEASNGEATAKSLLSVMCDAVCKLGSDLVLSNPCPHLEALLLRASSVGRATTWSFPSCIQESDVERVKDFFLKNNETGNAGSVHASLVDSVGTKVPVQIFHAPMVEMDGTVSNMVGILEECTDCFQMQRLAEVDGGQPAISVGKAMRSNEEESVGGFSGTSSSKSIAPSLISNWTEGGRERDQIAVDLAMSLNFQVVQESDESRALFAFSQDGPEEFLGRFSEGSNNQSVRAWLESLFAEARYCAAPLRAQKFGTVKILNPLATTAQLMELHGRLLQEGDSEEGPALRRCLAKLRLSYPLPPQSKRRHRRQRAWRLHPELSSGSFQSTKVAI